MTFIIDNNLSPHLAHGMREFGEEVEHLTDRFPSDAKDQEWIPIIAKEGHFLITRDEAIRRRPGELQALRRYKLGAFFLGGKNRSRCDLIRQLVRNWPRIKELAGTETRPFAFRVPPSGTEFTRVPL